MGATPSAPSSETPGGEDWGEFPPNHLDARKDLSDPQFPGRVGSFEFESRGGDANSVYADYDDAENFVGFTAWVIVNANRYSEHIERLTDVDHYGRAVCGHPGDFPEQTDCYMVGAQHVIYVGTASDISMEEMAALLEELYDAL